MFGFPLMFIFPVVIAIALRRQPDPEAEKTVPLSLDGYNLQSTVDPKQTDVGRQGLGERSAPFLWAMLVTFVSLSLVCTYQSILAML